MSSRFFRARFIVLIISLIYSVGVFAQDDVNFEVITRSAAEVGQTFQLEFRLNKKPESFTPPEFTGLNVIAGPTESSATSIEMVGTKINKVTTHSYIFVVQAPEAGKITIAPATAVIKKKSYTSQEKIIEIVQGNGGGETSGTRPRQQGNQSQTLAADDIIVRVTTSSRNVYKGEPIKISFKIYTRANLSGIDNIKLPAMNGFWTQELDASGYTWQEEVYNDKVYQSHIMREYIVFPQQAGELQIEQMTVSAVAQVVVQSGGGRNIFDDLFGGGPSVQNIRKDLATAPVKITVKELPAGAPADFNGAVGNFTLEGGPSATEIGANSSANYDIKISGSGNLPLINAPKVELPSSFEQYAAKSTENYGPRGNNISGSKQFSIPFIARAEGGYDIKPVTFSFFNPQSGKYVTLSTDETRMTIGKDASGSNGTQGIISGSSKEDVKILGSDIRFIRTSPNGLSKAGDLFLWSWGYFTALISLIAAFVALLVYTQKRIAFKSNTTLVKNKRARKVALSRLKTAEKNLAAKRKKEFYEEMLKALWGYMGDKLNIPAANLSKDNIRKELEAKDTDPALIDRYVDIISDCELAQYAPVTDIQEGNIYNSAVELISKLESKI